MSTFDLLLDLSKTPDQPEIAAYLETYLHCLYDARQIIHEEAVFTQTENSLRTSVTCLEPDSLDSKYNTLYANEILKKIEDALQSPVKFIPTGIDPRYPILSSVEKPSSYILFNGLFSPLYGGDTHEPIPLYKIPYTYHDGACYNDIRSWSHNYERIYGLWFNGAVGEQFALRQMQDPASALSKEGRAVCQRIEELTGVPTYYYLFNYRRRSLKKDMEWKCPVTGKDWLIAGAQRGDFIAFRCKESRLVSSFSTKS